MNEPFAIRGVIEGFYGEPWTHEQRIDMIRFIGRHRMNFYGYAPKDDPFCRHAWDRFYNPAQIAEFGELADVAAEAGVVFGYALSPGLTIRYSSAEDVDRLMAKFLQVVVAGARHLMLHLDDIPEGLQHQADVRKYDSLASAHADLANAIRSRLDAVEPDIALTVCPTVYSGRSDVPYLRTLVAQLAPRVQLFWDGPAVWCSEIGADDALTFAANLGREPIYWDNYPANDLSASGELHIGPYRGRDADLRDHSLGILVNPMPLAESSKIPIATIADFLWDPEAYDPEVSWERAIVEVAGSRDAESVRLFADNVRTSCLEPNESPLLTAELERLRFASRFGAATEERASAIATVQGFERAALRLLGPGVENQALAAELRPWLEAFRSGLERILRSLNGSGAPASQSSSRPAVFPPLLLHDLLPDAVPGGRWTTIDPE
jgi:hyaluronoglucosaminidase